MKTATKEKWKAIFLHNSVLKAISLGAAFIVWVAVSISQNDMAPFTVKNVPIYVDQQSEVVVRQGLNMISAGPKTVGDVQVYGLRVVVGTLKPEDISLNAEMGGVTGAGSYELPLEASNKSGKKFSIQSVTPAAIAVKFDKLLERKFTIEPNTAGLSVPEGYQLQSVQALPKEITITGPEAEINKIDRCVVETVNKQLNKTTTLTQPVILLDKDGNEVKSNELKLEYDKIEVKIEILKSKEIPLTIGFTNVPANFPVGELRYTLSNQSLAVAGPTDQVDSYAALNVGYVNLSTLRLDSVYNFDVSLPKGFTNSDNVESISVSFDTSGMVEKDFYVTNLQPVNLPANTEISLVTKKLTVHIVGPKSIVDHLTGNDFVGEIDLSDRRLTEGRVTMPVRIVAPGKGLVWACDNPNPPSALVDIKVK